MRVTALKPVPRHPDRLELWLEGGLRATLAAEIVLRAGLREGRELEPAALTVLLEGDEAFRARQAALDLLSHRARTAAELARRLARKGFGLAIADACVRDLVQEGLVRDDEFAETFVRDRVRSRPRSARRLVQELSARGVDRALAGDAVEAVFRDQQLSEADLARRAAQAWWRRNVGARAAPGAGSDEGLRLKRRLWGYLARRGFGADVIRTIAAALFEPAPGD